MSFAEFNSVNCSSQAITKVTEKLNQPQLLQSKTVVITGAKGSGRKTFAQFLQKKYTNFNNFKVVEVVELSMVEDQTIYISQDTSDVKADKDIFVIEMPTLAERKDDLLALAEFYIQVHALMSGKGKVIISEKAKEKILAYTWPGQFHEFERVIEKAVEKAVRNIVEPEHLNLDEASHDLNFSLGQKLENVERQYILQTLFFVQQNRTKAAEVLGISIRTLRNKLNQYRQEGYL